MTPEQAAREAEIPPEVAALALSDAENRAMWHRMEAEIDDLVEVVEEDGD